MQSSYHYSDSERGKDGSINPNYYQDRSEFSNKMTMWHVERMESFEQVIGSFKSFMMKYIARFDKKGMPHQDLHKIASYAMMCDRYITWHDAQKRKRLNGSHNQTR